MTQGIPDSVRAFVLRHIDSVEQLEVLLFMRSRADSGWHADEVARELRINPGSARLRLDDLAAAGLLASLPGSAERFRYQRGPHDHAVDRVAEFYTSHRVSMITMIFSKPSDKLLGFANAFRLRREDDDDG